eukprot:scaffold115279_cov47-Prasinocladus_malaysianus.AAC.1
MSDVSTALPVGCGSVLPCGPVARLSSGVSGGSSPAQGSAASSTCMSETLRRFGRTRSGVAIMTYKNCSRLALGHDGISTTVDISAKPSSFSSAAENQTKSGLMPAASASAC